MNLLSAAERDELLLQLNNEQYAYVIDFLKRGKKTVFANVMAKEKGFYLEEYLTDEERAELINDWILIDFIDGGPDWNSHKRLKCECGRVIRYQYIVKNYQRGIIKHFGETHFQEHTGLPANIVKEIINRFNRIDYELDEILIKIRDGWSLNVVIQDNVKLPNDIQEHLSLNLPLLKRQEKRLYKLLEEHNEQYIFKQLKENKFQHQVDVIPSDELINQIILKKQRKTNLQNQSIFEVSEFDNQCLTAKQKDIVIRMLNNGINSARFICEALIEEQPDLDIRYLTGKPKIYFVVCKYLEELLSYGKVELLGVDELRDRFYKVVND